MKKLMLVLLVMIFCLGLVSALNCNQAVTLSQGEFETFNGKMVEIIDINDNSVVVEVEGVTQIFTEGSQKTVNLVDVSVESISDEVTLSVVCENSGIRFAPGDEENTTVWVFGILVLLVFFGFMLYMLMRKPKKKKRAKRKAKKKAKKKVKKKRSKKKR
jgi:ATP-dependent Zn protease